MIPLLIISRGIVLVPHLPEAVVTVVVNVVRALIVLSVASALGAWGEFRIHVRGALNNGLSREEIGELLIQVGVYAGVPAANHAYKEAAAVFAEIDAESAG